MVTEMAKIWPKMGSRDNLKPKQVNLMKLEILLDDNVYIMHIVFICILTKIVVAMVIEMVKIGSKMEFRV